MLRVPDRSIFFNSLIRDRAEYILSSLKKGFDALHFSRDAEEGRRREPGKRNLSNDATIPSRSNFGPANS